ncbi:MAG TPA: pyridoxamine 5'-phosphate oxidase family protein [Acidimicrobiales bacterium]|nr:pyridoxamine 5'-phosphate oxidase family protein [Acidimicrobiales bacterium]
MTATLQLVRDLVAADHGLAVAVVVRADGTPHVSVVNAGVLDHPVDGEPVVGFVARGDTVKLRLLRARPHGTLVFRAGWRWVAVQGEVDLAGPDDPLPGLDGEGVRLLLRDIFGAAGGRHEDFDEYDRVMAAERRTAVLVRPRRITTNPGRLDV